MYEYDSSTLTTTTTAGSGEAALALLVGILIFLAVYAFCAYMAGRIFKKAGEAAWKAWVPVYNNWLFLEIGQQKGFWSLFIFIPGFNIIAAVFSIIAAFKIGESLGKGGAFVLLYIFLSPIWLIWLALDSSTWQGGAPTPLATTDTGTIPPAPVSEQSTPVSQPAYEPVAPQVTSPQSAPIEPLPTQPSPDTAQFVATSEVPPFTPTPAETVIQTPTEQPVTAPQPQPYPTAEAPQVETPQPQTPAQETTTPQLPPQNSTEQ